MAWTDEPTEAQLSAIFNLTKWVLPRKLGKAATDWLKATSDRRQVSDELKRIKNLSDHRMLKDKEVVFASEIWDGFDYLEFLA